MSFIFEAQSLDGTLTANLVDGTSYMVDDDTINLGAAELTDIGRTKDKNEERTTDADNNPRKMSWSQEVIGSSSTLRTRVNALKAIMGASLWKLKYNGGGSDDIDKYYICSRVAIPFVVNAKSLPLWRDGKTISFEARPFALDSAIELPRNFVIDPTMCEDYSGDGIPNSFSNDDSSPTFTHFHFSNALVGAQIYCPLTAATINQTAGIKQVIAEIDAGEIWSYRAEYKCDITQYCRYDIYLEYNDGGATKHYLLQNRTTYQGTWLEILLENQTAPAGATQATLVVRVTATSTNNIVGSIGVRDAMAVQASALTRGKNNAVIVYGSEWAETPTTFQLRNIPGDAEALTIMQLGETVGGAAAGSDKLYLGITPKGLDNRQLVFKFVDLQDSDTYCLSGKHSNAINVSLGVTLPATLKGKYWMIGRCRTYSTTYAADQYHAEVLCGAGVVFSTSKIVPFATQKWTEIPFGTVDFSFYNPDWGDIGYILAMNRDSGNNSWFADYIELMPLDAIARAEIAAVTVKQAMMSDTISDKEDLYRRSAVSNIPVIWPMDFAEVYPFAGNRYSNSVNLPNGDSNVVIHASPYPADTTQELSGRSGALLGIKLIPRWSE